MKMKQLSELTGISERTIRYYIADGIFIPEHYTENYTGRKSYDYSETDVKRLNQIALLRKYDFSIKDIKAFISGEADTDSVLSSHIQEVRKNTETQNENIKVMEKVLEKHPNGIDELCEMLSNPTVEQAPIPVVDEQAAYKPMYATVKKSQKRVVVAAVVVAVLLMVSLTFNMLFAESVLVRVFRNNREFISGALYKIGQKMDSKKYTTVYNDASMYDTVRNLGGLYLYGAKIFNESLLFPKTLNNIKVTNFYCEYYQFFFIGEGCQFVLVIEYSKDDLEKEVERLSSIDGGRIRYDEKDFGFPAYITLYGDYNTYEYALVDEANSSVAYVFLNGITKDMLVLDGKYLPTEFPLNGNLGIESFNIYKYRDNENLLELVEELSVFDDFTIKDGLVYFRCRVHVKNTTDRHLFFNINGVFEDDYSTDEYGNYTGLIKECYIYACQQEDTENRLFELGANQEETFNVYFIGTATGATKQKADRLLPGIRFEILEYSFEEGEDVSSQKKLLDDLRVELDGKTTVAELVNAFEEFCQTDSCDSEEVIVWEVMPMEGEVYISLSRQYKDSDDTDEYTRINLDFYLETKDELKYAIMWSDDKKFSGNSDFFEAVRNTTAYKYADENGLKPKGILTSADKT